MTGVPEPPEAYERPEPPEAYERPEQSELAEEPEPTGHPAVDAAVRALAQAAAADPADQVPEFQAAHRTLRETLATIDEQ